MMTIHQRLAELWIIQKKRALTDSEQKEMTMCLDVNAAYAWKMARLENQSLLASMTGDANWLHDICADIDKLEMQYRIRNPRK